MNGKKKNNPSFLIHQFNSCLSPQKTKVIQLEDLASHLGLRTQVSTDFGEILIFAGPLSSSYSRTPCKCTVGYLKDLSG